MSKVTVLPVRVQGVEAPAEIAGAIRYANEFKVADLIITGRGGGSIEDLWAFNEEIVARAIYASDIPVISAVGHEPDVTISDYVADARASTPSNAAEIAVPDREEMYSRLYDLRVRMEQAENKRLIFLREKLNAMAEKKVLIDVSAQIDNRRVDLDRIRDRMCAACDAIVNSNRQKYVSLISALDAMSPLKVLLRGYSIASVDGRIINSVERVHENDSVDLRLSDGKLICSVEGIERN